MAALRSGGATEAAAVAAMHIASWRSAYREMLPADFLERQSVAEWTTEWGSRLARAGTQLLLIEDDGALVAFAAFGPSRDGDADPALVWELYNLHVHPGRRGGGLGGQLFAAVVERGREAGRTTLTLWVVERNAPARRFYELKGLHADGATQVHHVGPGLGLAEVRYRGPIA